MSPVDVARSRIDTMLRTGHSDPTWFSAAFLAQVPASKVDELIASLKSSLGEYQSVEFTPGKFIAHFAKGTDDVLIHLDSNSKIDGLLFRPPVLTAASLDDGLRALRPSSGTLSYVITVEGRSERAALNASEPLAVGSAFKLAVLNAVHDEIAKGRLHWTDVVPLRHEWKSLPSGVLRTWPDGTPLTLATFAAEMISISDNTAADALVRLVGANALRPYAGQNQPFLTTREMFTLKSTPGADLRSAYLTATTPAARETILKRVDTLPSPGADQLLTTPELAVEWHYNVRQLCGLLTRIADVSLMSINPGLADPGAFPHVAFKGGSDLGVINLTTVVTTSRGTRMCFSATLNDSMRQVDESAFEAAYSGVLGLLTEK
jgi:beta-lactamase class A